jgi:hypothetical protein
MSDENTGMEPKGPAPDAAFEVDGVGNWNVHSNEDCGVHSTAGDCDAHSNNATPEFAPTQETATQFQTAYDYLNRHLFDNKLPGCLITLQRQRSSYGYFSADRFDRKDGQRTDEIAINPQHLRCRSIVESLSTLAHEMKHLEQHHFGKPGRGRYHNKEWADSMEAIGLIPSDTGRPGGKRTGDAVSHYIEPDGRFALAVEKLLATGFEITWREVLSDRALLGGADGSDEGGASLSGKRTKYTCPHPECTLNAWAKAGAALLCGEHRESMRPAD